MKAISALAALLLFSIIASAAPVTQKTLKGHVLPSVSHSTPVGHLSGNQQLRLAIGLSLPNQEQLTTFLNQLYDPANPNFHHYVTPQEFTERFGPSESDYQAVIDFAATNGLKVVKTHSNRMLVDVVASAAEIEKAFGINLQVYQHPTEPRTFYAPDREPSVPANLAIVDISGLDNYGLPQPKNLEIMSPQQMAEVNPNAGSGTNGLYQGNDFRAAYAPGVALTGTGQSVALLEFDGYNGIDITNYENLAGISPVPLQNILIDGFGGSAGGNNIEVALDIELVAAMAPGLSNILVYEATPGSPHNDILNQMATDNKAKQISSSWNWTGGPQTSTDQIFQQMQAQGQSYFNASGDSDAFTPGSVDDPSHTNSPSSSPYITQVGGTQLTTTGPGGSWVSETVWNSGSGIGSCGGISSFYSIPSWQTNINMTANQGSTTMRNIPDVAMTAIGISAVFTRNGISTNAGVGGTSCAAPLWAGFTALVNQQAASRGKQPVGFLNPALYAIGEGANYNSNFHDITTGNNFWSSSPANFSAVTGYDLCTGWGTPSGLNLINALMPDDLNISPLLGFSASGHIGGPFSPTSLNLTLTNTGLAALNWSLASNAVWLSASPSSGTLTPGGPATTVTVSLTSAATSLSGGNYTATIVFTNLNNHVVQSIPFNLSALLVQNGGFETGDFTGWTLNGNGSPDNLVTASNAQFQLPPHSGTYLALLGEQFSLSFLDQTISTTPGGTYLVSFWFDCDGTPPNEFLVNWNGQTLFDQINFPRTTVPPFGWTNMQFIVQATANNTVLEFGSRNDNSYFGLDDVSVTPIPTPVLQGVTKAGGSIQFSWNSLSGILYQLQYSTNLSKGNWTNLGSGITANGSSSSTSTTIGPDPQRFFRLQLLP
jgi:subtilase family serine protease